MKQNKSHPCCFHSFVSMHRSPLLAVTEILRYEAKNLFGVKCTSFSLSHQPGTLLTILSAVNWEIWIQITDLISYFSDC